jgi:hypothetical protein
MHRHFDRFHTRINSLPIFVKPVITRPDLVISPSAASGSRLT